MNAPQLDPLHFAYWLKGYCEITNRRMPSSGEWVVINDHLDAVFTKVTPERHVAPSHTRVPYISGPVAPWPSTGNYAGERTYTLDGNLLTGTIALFC